MGISQKPSFSTYTRSLEMLFWPIHYVLFNKFVVLQNGQKIKLETGGTVVTDWVLAVRLSPKEITPANIQTSTVAHAQVTCNVQGVLHTPSELSFLLHQNQPHTACNTQSQAGFVGLIRTTLQGWFTLAKAVSCMCNNSYIHHIHKGWCSCPTYHKCPHFCAGCLWQKYKIIIHHRWKATTKTVTQSLAEVPVTERAGAGRTDFPYKNTELDDDFWSWASHCYSKICEDQEKLCSVLPVHPWMNLSSNRIWSSASGM